MYSSRPISPGHPLLQTLVTRDYDEFAGMLLAERRKAQLPPYSHLALLGAEAASQEAAENFLHRARRQLDKPDTGLRILGPRQRAHREEERTLSQSVADPVRQQEPVEKSARAVVPIAGIHAGGKKDTLVSGHRSPGHAVKINGVRLD